MGIPLVALNSQPWQAPRTPLEEASRAAQLQQQQQQVQAGQQEMQMREQQMKDQAAQTKAMLGWDGKNYDDLAKSVLENGGSGQAAQAVQQHGLKLKETAAQIAAHDAETGSKHVDTIVKQHDLALGALQAAEQVPDEQLPAHLLDTVNTLASQGTLDPPLIIKGKQLAQSGLPPDQLRQQLKLFEKNLQGSKTQFEQAQAERKTAAEELNAQTAAAREAKPPSEEQNFQAFYKSKLGASGAQPSAVAEYAARQEYAKLHRNPTNNLMTGTDAKDIADAIENGDQPPTLQGLYRNAGPVRAELARRGVPLAKMETDWKATQKYMTTLNGPQQVRLRQAIDTASDSLDKIEGLYKEWQEVAPTSGFKVLNKASLASMKQLPGRPGAVATALDAQIADLTSELGNVYMGGNSPTDHSLSLAGKNLSSDWNKETFEEAIKQARANIGIRKNSITHGSPVGSGNNQYFQQQAPTNAETKTYMGATYVKQPDGSWKKQ